MIDEAIADSRSEHVDRTFRTRRSEHASRRQGQTRGGLENHRGAAKEAPGADKLAGLTGKAKPTKGNKS